MKITPYKARQRKAVALDVIAQIKAHRFDVTNMVYVEFATNELDEKTGSLQTQLRKAVTPSKPCQVCALGACFISTVRLYNDLDTKNAYEWGGIAPTTMREKLNQLFEPLEQDVIESSFEVEALCQGTRADHVEHASAGFVKFAGEFAVAGRFKDALTELEAEDRLILLMQALATIVNSRVTLDALRRAVTIQILTDKRFEKLRIDYLL